MPGATKLIYWDAAIFIAWLSEELRDINDVKAIQAQVNRFDKGELRLYTSVITITEVLKHQLSAKAFEKFRTATQRSNFEFIAVNRQIATIGHDVRDYYSTLKDEVSSTLTTPDAIHVATAIVRKCETFYTFDAKDRPGKNRALLSISGTVASKYFLDIQKPQPSSTPS